ncbi:MAG: ABC transporter substrate-binding protein [Bryobacteraceae bacterium]
MLVLVSAAALGGAIRPRYGGVLRVEMRDWTSSLDPAEADASPARERLSALAFDSLGRLDGRGAPQPSLAVAWERDARHWRFRLRSGVRFHDGTPLTAPLVATALESLGAGVAGDVVLVPAGRPIADVARRPVVRRVADGSLTGTGPFRVTQWEAGRRAVFAAFDEYWGGRPFLDTIEVAMGRSTRDQFVDLELDKADVVELGAAESRRARRTWTSPPVELIAVVFASPGTRVREALALALDRASMHGVLLQKQGVVSGGLLPQWLSGYAHLFPVAQDLESARAMRAAQPLQLAFDPLDTLARSIAQRIAVNAREAGIVVRSPATGTPDARLARVRIASTEASAALAEIAAALDLPAPAAATSAEALYAAERVLLGEHRVIPLFHLPQTFGLSPRVRNWSWALDEVWLAPQP